MTRNMKKDFDNDNEKERNRVGDCKLQRKRKVEKANDRANLTVPNQYSGGLGCLNQYAIARDI